MSLKETIDRLNKNVCSNYYQNIPSERLVEKVSENHVSIYGKVPGKRNSFNRELISKFEEKDGEAILSGYLQHLSSVKIFISICIGFVLFWGAIVISIIIANLDQFKVEALLFPIAGFFMFFAKLLFLKFGKWACRNNKEWLVNKIKLAVNQCS